MPRHDIPPTNSSRYTSVLPPSFHVPKQGHLVIKTIKRKDTAPQTLVAIYDVLQTVNPRDRVATGLRPIWYGVRKFRLRLRDLIPDQVQRTLCSLRHRLCPRLRAEFAIQPHPRGHITSLSSHQGW